MVTTMIVIDRLLWYNPHYQRMVPLPLLSNHHPIRLTLYSMMTSPSDYDMPSDQIDCPCGEEIPWKTGSVGEALELSRNHLREKHGKLL
jgi:hypothetical protein